MTTTDRYMPALRYRWLTPFYDPLLKYGMREQVFKKRLIEQAHLAAGMRLLDLGCGTATLTIMIKSMVPEVEVIGIDGDPAVLDIARSKIHQAGLDIPVDLGMADALPYQEGYFDRVVSSMVMHHLSRDSKSRALRESRRVLKPNGELHLVDFGVPASPYARLTAGVMRNFENVEDNISGRLIEYIRKAEFSHTEEAGQANTFFGTLTYYRATR